MVVPIAVSAEDGIDLMLSWDTTGSMYPSFAEVKRRIRELISELFRRVPNVRIGIIAHGDYCDARIAGSYVTKMLDLTNDQRKIEAFVEAVGKTNGGDAAECYELVLHKARDASWSAKKARVLVVFGDEVPHSKNEAQNELKLDWKNEAEFLRQIGVTVYSVQCLNRGHASSFYSKLAEITGGLHLKLNQFRHVMMLLMGIGVKQTSSEALQEYQQELQTQGQFGYDLRDMFDTLAGRRTAARAVRKDGLMPVDPARFQPFEVMEEQKISAFVRSMGIEFEKGRGFYPHVTRTEEIQEDKEVLAEDLITGEFFTGPEVREMIGLPFGSRGNIRPNPVPGYRIWVQSNSHNRTLREKGFLYEVPKEGEASRTKSRKRKAGTAS